MKRIFNLEKLQVSQELQNWALTLLLLPFTVYFRFIGGTWLVHNNNYPESVLNLIVLASIFGIWIIWKVFFDDYFYLTGLENYLGILIAAIALSTLFSSNITLSLGISVGSFAAIGAIYILLDFSRSEQIWESLLNAILITGGINVALIMVRVLLWFRLFGIRWNDLKALLTFGLDILPRLPDLPNMNSNVTAVYFLILIPLGIYRLISSKKIFWKILIGIYLLVSLGIIFLTRSRGAMIGLIVVGLSAVVLYADQLRSLPRKKTRTIYLIGFFLLLIVSQGVYYVISTRGYRISLDTNIAARLQGWITVWEIIKRNPLFGSGLGTFAENYLLYRDPDISSSVILHAHNELFQIAGQIGLLGLGACILLSGVFIKRFLSYQSDQTPDHIVRNRFYLLSISGFLGMGLVDSFLNSSNIQFLFLYIFIGLLPTCSIRQVPKSRLLITGLLVVYLTSFGIDAWENWKLKPYHLARLAAYDGNWNAAAEYLTDAINRDKNNPYYVYAEALVLGQKAFELEGDFDKAIQAYSKSINLYPKWGPLHANLACLHDNNGDPQLAESAIRMAIQHEPETYRYQCMLGDFLVRQNKIQEALTAYSNCIASEPEWLDTLYWKGEPIKADFIEDIILLAENLIAESYPESAGLKLAQVEYHTQDYAESKAKIDEYLSKKPNDIDGLLLLADLFSNDNQLDDARDILDRILHIEPREWKAWFILGKMQLQAENTEEALNKLKISASINGTPSLYLYIGKAFEQLGDQDLMVHYYQKAANRQLYGSLFSNWVGYRFPIPGERLPCYPERRTLDEFYIPFSEVLLELENENSCLAFQIYRQVFDDRDKTNLFPELDNISYDAKSNSSDCERDGSYFDE